MKLAERLGHIKVDADALFPRLLGGLAGGLVLGFFVAGFSVFADVSQNVPLTPWSIGQHLLMVLVSAVLMFTTGVGWLPLLVHLGMEALEKHILKAKRPVLGGLLHGLAGMAVGGLVSGQLLLLGLAAGLFSVMACLWVSQHGVKRRSALAA